MKNSMKLKRRALLASCALVAAASAFAVDAAAQTGSDTQPVAPLRLRSDYFGWGASVSPRVGFSDNINLAPRGFEQGSLMTGAQFSGGAIMSKRRFTGIISGDVDLAYLSRGNDKFAVNQRVGATSTTTVVDDLLYLDVSGST
ncbi:MAG: hypothetical protein K2Q06_09025, partial [Parvularculaceae bacterium]|nr:hypothetical protein [Parvularculaceae bacterium]